MKKLTKAQQAERNAALETLRKIFPKGATVHCRVEHVSRSGMLRHISIRGYFRNDDGSIALAPNGEPMECHPDYSASLVLGWPMAREGIKVPGCGMDMCFHLVYTLSHYLHGDGYALNHR